MRSEAAFPAAIAPPRLTWTTVARLTLPFVIITTLLVELALAERKYALFGGGFGQSQALDAPLEIIAFLAGILACQTVTFMFLHRLVHCLHGGRVGTPLFHFNFAFFIGGGAIGLTIAKYQALSYFSDAMSLQIVRNLGGGSLADALLYSLSEAGLILIALAGAAAVYGVARFLLQRRWRDTPPLPDRYRIGWATLLAAFAATSLLLFAVNRIDDARPALARFNGVQALATLLHKLTDFDRDDWSFYSYPIDRQPFDGSRHPYALDIPNNAIDEDGIGGDFVFAGTFADAPTPVITGAQRNVVLIVLESTRADAIGRVVDGRPLTPNLDALAARGSAARAAYSHVGFTTFSLQSLFTGELAPVDDRQSLVRDFLANGYDVGVISGQAEDFGDTANLTGMRRGSLFVDGTMLKDERASAFAAQGSVNIDGKILLREFDRALGRRDAWARPRFLYMNLQSAHFPYYGPGMDRILAGEPIPRGEISAANRDRVERTYLNAIAYNDRLIGALIERLRRLGVLDDTLIVVTADHGESLFDDGFLGHGHMLNDQQTRIPFILSDPGLAPGRPIGLADMRGIILRAAGAPPPPVSDEGVFQYLGTLDRPGSIGLVGADGKRIVYDLFRDRFWSDRTGQWTRYDDLAAGSAERRAADALVQRWARERWRRHLRM